MYCCVTRIGGIFWGDTNIIIWALAQQYKLSPHTSSGGYRVQNDSVFLHYSYAKSRPPLCTYLEEGITTHFGAVFYLLSKEKKTLKDFFLWVSRVSYYI
jgi:hypothetical protein